MKKPMEPHDYLAQHEIAVHLKASGVSDEQMQAVSLNSLGGLEFELWRAIAGAGWPDSCMNDLKAWATLRWLVLDNPPESRDKKDAWNFIALHLATPLIDSGRRHLQAAKDGAQQSKEEGDARAIEFINEHTAALEKNKRLSVAATASRLNIPCSTASRYWRKRKSLNRPD